MQGMQGARAPRGCADRRPRDSHQEWRRSFRRLQSPVPVLVVPFGEFDQGRPLLISCHPAAQMVPITAGKSLAGCSTPPEQLAALLEAGKKYKAYRFWDRIRIGRSQQDITGNGFNAIRFDPRKPAHTIRPMDSNLGMGGAMHNADTRIMPRRSGPWLKTARKRRGRAA